MAWIADTLWSHPKFVGLTPAAAWTWVKAVTYSSGYQTRGRLTPAQTRLLGATAKIEHELVLAGLWHPVDGGVEIHDWEDHNGLRDERRAADRERKRHQRERDRAVTSP